MSEMKEAALRYARKGMAVFPVQPNGKAPVGKLAPSGVKDATTDERQIKDWWQPIPSANIGMATGIIFAVDLDVKEDIDGRKTWQALQKQHDEAPETTTVRTPSGGKHLYFRAPEGTKVKNSVSDALGEGVDVRGHGGYVIVPPSSSDDGKYEFITQSRVANAPFWLLSKVTAGSTNEEKKQAVEEAPDTIPQGKRNDSLTSLAGYLRRKGLGTSEIEQSLQAVNESRCQTPLPQNEIRKIAESVSRYDPSDGGLLRSEQAAPAPEEYKEIARRLIGNLYTAPQHGSIVAAILNDGEAMPPPYGDVYETMMEQGLEKGDLDRARVDVHLNGTAEAVKDPDYEIHHDDPSQLVSWATALRSRHTNARIASDLKQIAREIEGEDSDPIETVGRVINRMREHTNESTSRMVPIEKAARDALMTVQEWKEGVTSDRMWTWPSVDDKIGGFVCGEMTVIGGFTSGFKTASLVDLAKRVALRNQNKEIVIPIFSAEMDAETLSHRVAANMCNVSPDTLRPDRDGTVTATDQQFQKYESALDRTSHLSIEIDENPNPSYDQMLSHCLQAQSQSEIAFIGFDYLEKMDEQGDTEELRVSKIAQKLKALAKRLQVPVVVLSQYSRQQSPHTELPKNYYLRYSGKIEQEAQQIIHWFYPKYFVDRGADEGAVAKYDPSDPHQIFAVCGKNRDGKIQNAKMHVNESTGRFIDRYDEESRKSANKAPF